MHIYLIMLKDQRKSFSSFDLNVIIDRTENFIKGHLQCQPDEDEDDDQPGPNVIKLFLSVNYVIS